ncbi:hypothetical protein CBOM_07982 [Ceraceosorus bombacis]|uniref:Uncharacterized protein n=1 Tax=Ceraceosorus bombacis TaxID=401625 RepID=A0A0P1BIC7_9BASI|nr:hypothetical protein CBOM_07982 [Ceraceosorus bombacis]
MVNLAFAKISFKCARCDVQPALHLSCLSLSASPSRRSRRTSLCPSALFRHTLHRLGISS